MLSSQSQTKTQKYKKIALISFLLLLGVFIRFYFQFLEWSFNGDEVDLGLEIVGNAYKDLFYPFQSKQSAPPLFLLTEKLISEAGKPYISLKILCFLSSCGSLLLFNRLLKFYFPFYLQVLLLALFCFNPFIIGNSLSLKQYSLDLTLGLVAVSYFISNRNSYISFLFFSLFCLFSNVGLFFCTAMTIFYFFNFYCNQKRMSEWKDLKKILPFLLAPIPYLVYFAWFMQQTGAERMKSYMVNYWSTAFVPLNLSIFKWLAIQGKVITLFFFSSYWVIGFLMLLLFLLSMILVFQNRGRIFQNRLLGIVLIYVLTAGIHLVLSALKLYPFSDRLFLYLAPGIYIILGYGILQLHKKIKYRVYSSAIYFTILLIPLFTSLFYFSYLPQKTNDVVALQKFVHATDPTFSLTPKAKYTLTKWVEFSQYDKLDFGRLINAHQVEDGDQLEADLLIGVQSVKFGHTRKLTTPEPIIDELLLQDKIFLYDRIGGYAIYKVK